MRHLLEVRRGNNMPVEHDISTLIPNMKDYYEQTISSWEEMSQLEQSSTCPCEPLVGVTHRQRPKPPVSYPISQEIFGANEHSVSYPGSIHVDLNHKCYPYGGGVAGDRIGSSSASSFGPNWFESMSRNLYNDCTNNILGSLVKALVIKHYEKTKNEKSLFDVFKIVVECMNQFPNLIQGIFSVDSVKRIGWTTTIFVQVSDVTSFATHELKGAFSNLRAPFSIRIGSKKDMDQILMTMDSFSIAERPVVNWSFRTNVIDDVPIFTFQKYRMQESNQYKVCVSTSNHLMTNIPEDVNLLVNAGSKLSFNVYVRGVRFIPVSISVGGTQYLLSTYGLCKLLNEKGISVQEIELSTTNRDGAKKGVNITVQHVSEDLEIQINEAMMDYLPDVFSILVPSAEGTLTSGPKLEPVYVNLAEDTVSGKLLFQFKGTTQLHRGDKVKVYAVPMGSYDELELSEENLCTASITQASFGFGEDTYYELTFSAPMNVTYDDELLLRVVFDEGTIFGNRLYNTTSVMEVLNESFAVQFDLDISANVVCSVYSNQLVPASSWTPIIPGAVLNNQVTLSKADAYPYFELISNNNRSCLLTQNALFEGNIPTGIPENSIYSVIQRYYPVVCTCKSVLSVQPTSDDSNAESGTETEESFYFATIALPIGLVLPNRRNYQLGDMVIIPKLLVQSSIFAAFNIDCRTVGLTKVPAKYPEESDEYFVTYLDASRPYLNGYIDIPVVFSNKDTIVISIPDFGVDFVVNVDIPEQEGGNEGESGNEGVENPDSGDEGDTPVDGDENTGDEGTTEGDGSDNTGEDVIDPDGGSTEESGSGTDTPSGETTEETESGKTPEETTPTEPTEENNTDPSDTTNTEGEGTNSTTPETETTPEDPVTKPEDSLVTDTE